MAVVTLRMMSRSNSSYGMKPKIALSQTRADTRWTPRVVSQIQDIPETGQESPFIFT